MLDFQNFDSVPGNFTVIIFNAILWLVRTKLKNMEILSCHLQLIYDGVHQKYVKSRCKLSPPVNIVNYWLPLLANPKNQWTGECIEIFLCFGGVRNQHMHCNIVMYCNCIHCNVVMLFFLIVFFRPTSDQTCPSRSTVDHVVTSKSEISSVFPLFSR